MFPHLRNALLTLSVLVLIGNFSTPISAQLIGPYPDANTPYLSFANSPFASINFSSGYFYLETFEDGLFNTPGVTSNHGNVYGPAFNCDSVDADDGVIDGFGRDGHSYFYISGRDGIQFNFDASTLGALPTHAGLAWTDGAGLITFEAFDENGISLGTVTGNHADNTFDGTTGEDRFYGVINAGGISSIKISNSEGGIEVDHLQYGLLGNSVVPEPGAITLLLASGLTGAGLLARRRRK